VLRVVVALYIVVIPVGIKR